MTRLLVILGVVALGCGGPPPTAAPVVVENAAPAPAPLPPGACTKRSTYPKLDRRLRERVDGYTRLKRGCPREYVDDDAVYMIEHGYSQISVSVTVDPAMTAEVARELQIELIGTFGLVTIDLDDLPALERLVAHPLVLRLAEGNPKEANG